ncbi:biotin transport system substrate-specific component [Alteribacillus persepolensis]|uniref:Biotin transporter n=1 Tax=Alteribacillus persepolensis TaxID=568899 RepID=A0A1G8EUB6_9BACI|nr:biotin transporter BioY [Alteribacillus persepolensis]SDH73460.1 biotin transport system substrate-specific component [Alteribacillus persepolensis]
MKTTSMLYAAMFAAVIGVLGLMPPIPLPFTPVPVTAQTLGVMLAGSLLGAKLGGGSVLLFVALVAVGMPLLAGGRGGLGILLGPSGGYVLSWPIAAFVIGWLIEKTKPALYAWKAVAVNCIGGILIIHSIGIIYLAFVANLPLYQAALSSLGFLPGDTAKAVGSGLLTVKLARSHPFLVKSQQSRLEKTKRAG